MTKKKNFQKRFFKFEMENNSMNHRRNNKPLAL